MDWLGFDFYCSGTWADGARGSNLGRCGSSNAENAKGTASLFMVWPSSESIASPSSSETNHASPPVYSTHLSNTTDLEPLPLNTLARAHDCLSCARHTRRTCHLYSILPPVFSTIHPPRPTPVVGPVAAVPSPSHGGRNPAASRISAAKR